MKLFVYLLFFFMVSCGIHTENNSIKQTQHYPPWILNPFYQGYIGAVGVARKDKNLSLTEQREIAIAVAQGHISQIIRTVISSNFIKIERYNYNKKKYKKIIKFLSKQSSEAYLKHIVIKDEWIDKKTGDYYVWVILEIK